MLSSVLIGSTARHTQKLKWINWISGNSFTMVCPLCA
jgi:hypothetical protein